MISKKSKNDAEVEGLVSDKVVMFLLEGLINKHITEDQVEFQQLVKPLAIHKFKCQQCEKTFISKQCHALHITRTHVNKYSVCGENCTTEESLKRHITNKHQLNSFKMKDERWKRSQ